MPPRGVEPLICSMGAHSFAMRSIAVLLERYHHWQGQQIGTNKHPNIDECSHIDLLEMTNPKNCPHEGSAPTHRDPHTKLETHSGSMTVCDLIVPKILWQPIEIPHHDRWLESLPYCTPRGLRFAPTTAPLGGSLVARTACPSGQAVAAESGVGSWCAEWWWLVSMVWPDA